MNTMMKTVNITNMSEAELDAMFDGQATAETVIVGSAWVSGNTFRPFHETVRALLTWDKVPAKELKSWRTIEYWMTDDEFKNRVWVKTNRGVTPMDVFAGTRYVSNDAMIAAYAAKR